MTLSYGRWAMLRKVEINCEKCFHNIKANSHKWGIGDHEWERAITRDYYLPVFDCGNPLPTNLISEEALAAWFNREHDKIVTDHCFSPQFMGRFVMDNADIYLTDYEKFRSLFIVALTTIQVTDKQNTLLRSLTKNRNGVFKIKKATHKKYNHLGINLYRKEDNQSWDKSIPTDNILSEIIYVPQELIEYEKQYLTT